MKPQSRQFNMLLKDLYTHRSSTTTVFQIITTLIFCFSIALFVLVLGLFITDRMRKFFIYEDIIYIPQIQKLSSVSPSPLLPQCNSTSSSSNSSLALNFTIPNNGLEEWIAPKTLWHSMSDEELMWRASMSPSVMEYPYNRTPKVSFMFLVRGKLPLGPIWERFFKGHERFFSIYLHCSPEFTEEPSESSVFFKRRIPSKTVEWGMASMLDAERRLLANALLDFSNERFVLLSETCIPLFNFTTVYNYLINSKQSFLSSFDDPRPVGRGRYNKRMWPILSISDWRKGSQWFEVNRKVALDLISDQKYYPVFRDHCKPPCYMDEHYMATLVSILNPELNSNRSITWVDWSHGGPHPKTFVRNDISKEFLNRIRYPESNCTYNGYPSSICYLFARKFHPNTLDPLLQITPELLDFNNTTIQGNSG